MNKDKPVFTAEFFKNNRRRLREKFGGSAPIILAANGLLQKSVDSSYPFVQDSNFWYLTGTDKSGLVLVLDKTGDYLILPAQSRYMKLFDGEINTTEIMAQSAVEAVYEHEEGWAKLSKRLLSAKHFAGIEAPPDYVEELGIYTNPARATLHEKIIGLNPGLRFVDIRQYLSELRAIKQDIEISAIKAATKATIDIYNALKAQIPKSKFEYELAATAAHEIVGKGLDYAYEPIIAGGKNATTLHYISNDQPFKKADLLLIDLGAKYSHYCSDITRTYSLNPSRRQRQIHDNVRQIQNYALELLGPGINIREYENQVRDFAAGRLIELGLIKRKDAEEVNHYYPHMTSHFVGLDAHDPFPSDHILRPNMVISCEPGIYIPEESIGVRLEDLVLITAGGIENLSDNLPRDIDPLE